MRLKEYKAPRLSRMGSVEECGAWSGLWSILSLKREDFQRQLLQIEAVLGLADEQQGLWRDLTAELDKSNAVYALTLASRKSGACEGALQPVADLDCVKTRPEICMLLNHVRSVTTAVDRIYVALSEEQKKTAEGIFKTGEKC